MLFGEDEKHHCLVAIDLPDVRDFVRVTEVVFPFERGEDQDQELNAGLLVEALQLLVELLDLRRVEEVGVVVVHPLRGLGRDVQRQRGRGEERDRDERDRAAADVHRVPVAGAVVPKLKLTSGAFCDPAAPLKYAFGLKPLMLATIFAGNLRTDELNVCATSL